MKRFLPFLCCLLFLAGCTAPSADAEPAQVQFFSMDTVMSIRVYNEGGEDAIQAARQEVERLDKLLSRTNPDSQISLLNSHAGDGTLISLDAEVADLLSFAKSVSQLLPGCFDITIAPVMDAWGFTFKTVAFVWVKQCRKSDNIFTGMGYWTRANAEICLLATRGHPKRAARDVKQVILSHVEEHSKKPDEARRRIEALMGDVPRIELFARQATPGWDVWGNEVASDIQLAERS